jgi:hypothetical protein
LRFPEALAAPPGGGVVGFSEGEKTRARRPDQGRMQMQGMVRSVMAAV